MKYIVILLILLCSCRQSKQHVVIYGDLVKVFDNYPLNGKCEESYTREIHLVFRIVNTTSDTLFIPMEAMGYSCNSKICFSVGSKEGTSFATLYGKAASTHVLLAHDSIDCGITIYQDELIAKNMSLPSLLRVLNVVYLIDDTDKEKSKYLIPEIRFDIKEDRVKYFYDNPNRGGPM